MYVFGSKMSIEPSSSNTVFPKSTYGLYEISIWSARIKIQSNLFIRNMLGTSQICLLKLEFVITQFVITEFVNTEFHCSAIYGAPSLTRKSKIVTNSTI
jgi:hypothetical protein